MAPDLNDLATTIVAVVCNMVTQVGLTGGGIRG